MPAGPGGEAAPRSETFRASLVLGPCLSVHSVHSGPPHVRHSPVSRDSLLSAQSREPVSGVPQLSIPVNWRATLSRSTRPRPDFGQAILLAILKSEQADSARTVSSLTQLAHVPADKSNHTPDGHLSGEKAAVLAHYPYNFKRRRPRRSRRGRQRPRTATPPLPTLGCDVSRTGACVLSDPPRRCAARSRHPTGELCVRYLGARSESETRSAPRTNTEDVMYTYTYI